MKFEEIPTPPRLPFFGNLFSLDFNRPTQSMAELAAKYGSIYRMILPAMDMVVVSSPELSQELSDEEKFPKLVHGPLLALRDLVGDGLFTSDTSSREWQKGHRIVRGLFSSPSVKQYHPTMIQVINEMFESWDKKLDEPVDVSQDMTKLAVEIIFRACADHKLGGFTLSGLHPVAQAMAFCFQEATNRSLRPPFLNALINPIQFKYKRSKAMIFKYICDIIENRVQQKERPNDMLTKLIETVDPVTGESFSVNEIKDQLLTFLIAGHETTKGILAFAFYELGRNKDIYEKVKEEILAVSPSNEEALFEDISKMRYLDFFVKEVIRMWPTALAYTVKANSDQLLGGKWPVRPDQSIVVLMWSLHRNKNFWGDRANEFDPERWQNLPQSGLRYSYQPWGRGQRSCIGQVFANHEIKLAIAMIMKKYDFETSFKSPLEVSETLSILPKGLKLLVRKRKNEIQ